MNSNNYNYVRVGADPEKLVAVFIDKFLVDNPDEALAPGGQEEQAQSQRPHKPQRLHDDLYALQKRNNPGIFVSNYDVATRCLIDFLSSLHVETS